MASETEATSHGIDVVVNYLDDRAIPYDVVDHEATYSATAEARVAGVEPDHAAKSVLLRDHDSYRLAVVPASERLDLHKAREALDATSHLRLATEAEMEADFPGFDTGALPPLGPVLPAPEVIDSSLTKHKRILCSGGDHRHSLLVDPAELARISEGRIADICEEEGRR
jgi:Ala-tRNA(Pro) deacylase